MADADELKIFPSISQKKNPLQKKSFNIIYENIRSLKNKLDEVVGQVEEEMDRGIIVHVVAIIESWVTQSNINQIKLKNYGVAHSLRKTGRRGGNTFFLHNSLNFDQSTDILTDIDF